MTTFRGAGHKNRTRVGHPHDMPSSESLQARLFLALACVWPLVLMALLTSSSQQHQHHQEGVSPHRAISASVQDTLRNVLDRVDVLGYGPTHPRLAVVIVGDARQKLVQTVESVFGNTDMNRIFMVVVVADGVEEDAALKQELMKIDHGTIPHWHGLRPDVHTNSDADEEDEHGRKMHVMFHPKALGVAESRKDAVDFISILEKHHEQEGIKSPEEDLILVLLESGVQFTVRIYYFITMPL
jgi:hypothetical protein